MDHARSNPATPTVSDDLSALLAELEAAMPDLSADVLDREVAELLGREATVPSSSAAKSRREQPNERRRKSGRSEFEWYTHLVARWSVMSQPQTIAAAIEIEAGLFAAERLATTERATLDRRTNADLHRLVEIGERSFARLVLSNLRLVFHWSKGVAQSVDSDWAQDAFQAGCLGLMRGIQGWDYKMGFTLSTFVSWHVRQAIQRWRANEILLIRIPVHVWESLNSEDKDLAPALQLAATRAQNIFSLDEMDGEEPWFEYDGGLNDATDDVERAATLSKALDSIPEREGLVLRMRYGIGDDIAEPMTLEAIGAAFGFTRERARQLETRGKDKLKAMSELRDLIA